MTRRSTRSTLLPWVTLLAGMLGCSPQPAASPSGTVNAYAAAIEAGRLQDAYGLLSEETRASLTFSDFERLVKENRAEIDDLIETLQAQEAPPLVSAQVRTRDGEVLTLLYENGAWRIDTEAVDLYSQRDPRVALASFVRAYDHHRYDVLLRFIPDEQKEGIDAALLKEAWEGEMKIEMEQTVEALRVALDSAALEVLGDRASLSYGTGGTAELVREHGVWKIENFQ